VAVSAGRVTGAVGVDADAAISDDRPDVEGVAAPARQATVVHAAEISAIRNLAVNLASRCNHFDDFSTCTTLI
jgi:hypothetical protein